ncbi:MAG: hypothetical protein QOG83_1007 [Alphaproteobacteria bacterium]|nr:hypothetical protein [Alphaproteobacteria bacterium]
MPYRSWIGAIALLATLAAGLHGARAFDESKYPAWKGQWLRAGSGQGAPWDPSKPGGLAQQAPLTPEYQALYEANLKDQAAGGQGADPSFRCIPVAMPRVMIAVQPMEIVISPDATYIMLELFSTLRRIFTDGRTWPKDFEPSFSGYSIGQWQDTDGDGRYDTLVVETRGIKVPHTYDSSGIPFHADGEAVIKERIYSDKDNPNVLYNEVTVADHALTRPWTVKRSYRRDPNPQPMWFEYQCTEDNHHVQIGKENYVISGDGYLMPVRKGQAPPDLKYFNQTSR